MARFIVVEGIDGSGTTTQARALVRALEARGEPAEFDCEPTDRPVGRVLRDLLSGSLESADDETSDRRLFAYLFAADRHDHLENAESGIKRRLAAGINVVCARYVLSSLAYEGEGRDELAFVEQLNRDFPFPDLTLYLDCPVTVSLNRIRSTRPSVDVFENEAKLTRVRHAYERLLEDYEGRHLTVDATLPESDITARALAAL